MQQRIQLISVFPSFTVTRLMFTSIYLIQPFDVIKDMVRLYLRAVHTTVCLPMEVDPTPKGYQHET